MLTADSALLRALGHSFQGMAVVESVDPEEPSATTIKDAVTHFKEALKHLDAVKDAEERLIGNLKEIKGGAALQTRIEVIKEDVGLLRNRIDAVMKRAADGQYPRAVDCATLALAEGRIMTLYERNARVVLRHIEKK